MSTRAYFNLLCLSLIACLFSPAVSAAQTCNPGDVIVADGGNGGQLVKVTQAGVQQIVATVPHAFWVKTIGQKAYITNQLSGAVYVFDCATLTSNPLAGVPYASSIAVDSQRSVLYGDSGTTLWRYDLIAGGSATTILTSASVPEVSAVTDMAVDQNGCLIASSNNNTSVYRFPVSGICSTPVGTAQVLATSADIGTPSGVDINRTTGAVYVADAFAGYLLAIASNGSKSALTTDNFFPGGVGINQATGDIFSAGSFADNSVGIVRVAPISGANQTLTSGGNIIDPVSVAVFGSAGVCGNGVLEAGEECDDGNTLNGDCCNSSCHFEAIGASCDDGNQCNGVSTCNGAGLCVPTQPLNCDDNNPCTVDSCDAQHGCTHTFAQDGTPCSDNSLCTIGDKCVAGSCAPGTPMNCNDGNPCTVDSCNPNSGCVFTSGPRPAAGAVSGAVSAFTLKSGGTKPTANTMKFSLTGGSAVNFNPQLGNPITGSTSYGICAWETSQGTAIPFFSEVIPAQGALNGAPFWKQNGSTTKPTGFEFSDKLQAHGGIKQLKVVAGAAGKSSLSLKAGGVNLPVPPPADPNHLLSQDPMIVIQVENSAGTYWQSHFMTPADKNTSTQFNQKSR